MLLMKLQRKSKKCKTKDCKNRIESKYTYCSIECACYDGVCSVRNGWIKKGLKSNG